MKMFSDCSGECCICVCGDGGCLAGHGDDDFYLESKDAIISRLDNGQYKPYTDIMIGTLKSRYGYDYKVKANDVAARECISSNEYKNRELNLTLTDLVYNKTFEEEMEEQRKLNLAISHLEGLGVEVVSEYGFYRNIYNVLKDLGECLDKKNA